MSSKRPRGDTVTYGRDTLEELAEEFENMGTDPNHTDFGLFGDPGGLEESDVAPELVYKAWPQPKGTGLGAIPGFDAYKAASYRDAAPANRYALRSASRKATPSAGSASSKTKTTNRTFENGYQLPGDDVPKYVDRPDFRAQPVTKERPVTPPECKGAIKYIMQHVAYSFPDAASELYTAEAVAKAESNLTTPHAFYHEHVYPILRTCVSRAVSSANKSDTNQVFRAEGTTTYDWKRLWNLCEKGDKKERQERWEALFAHFETVVDQNFPVGTALHAAMIKARKHRETLKEMRLAGQMAFDNAHFIPCHIVERAERKGKSTKLVDERFIVESASIRDLALQSGALSESQMLLVDESWTRIVKPPPEAGLVGIVLFNADTVKDDTITMADIIGGGIHGADVFTTQASEVTQGMLAMEMGQLVTNLQRKESFRRGFAQFGSMVKTSVGTSTTNGQLHQVRVPIDAPGKSAQKQARILEQQNLRREVEANSAFIQGCNYMLLEGFLPGMAQEQMDTAVKCGLINDLGFPDTASFGSFAYCAPPHTDNDDTATMGWVSARSPKILSDESNFFWSEFRVIIELAENFHWVWNARTDPHGTTLSRLVAQMPKSWKTMARNRPDEGQWSRANVITKAAAQASKRAVFAHVHVLRSPTFV
ncbi:hypothetical protein PENSPDRAFT_694681 [Peniophora sp. CONT]|nr:hypothetical protein PENSPDRAFT_694681 [Peniophora sp. CONT]